MKKIISAACVLMLSMAVLSPASRAEELGLGVSGEQWNMFGEDEDGLDVKQAYVLGIYTGYYSGRADYDAAEKRHGDLYWDTSYELLVEALDQFFSDPKNGKIAVFQALRVIAQELRGTDRSEIDGMIEDLRKAAEAYPPDYNKEG